MQEAVAITVAVVKEAAAVAVSAILAVARATRRLLTAVIKATVAVATTHTTQHSMGFAKRLRSARITVAAVTDSKRGTRLRVPLNFEYPPFSCKNYCICRK